MKIQFASLIMSALKGSPIACLMLMWIVRKTRKNFSRDELAELLGMNSKTIAGGLKTLARNGLIERVNFETWQLTTAGSSLDFNQIFDPPAGDELWEHELHESPENGLSASSGFKRDNGHVHDHDSLKQLLPRVHNMDSHVVRETILAALENPLITKFGTTQKNARDTILAALAGGQTPQKIIVSIVTWGEYCRSPAGQGTKPALFIPARLRAGQAAPEITEISMTAELEITRLTESINSLLEENHEQD